MRLRTSAAWRATSKPATRAVPAVGDSSVARMRSVVVLPAPLGPRKPKISPARDLEVDAGDGLDRFFLPLPYP